MELIAVGAAAAAGYGATVAGYAAYASIISFAASYTTMYIGNKIIKDKQSAAIIQAQEQFNTAETSRKIVYGKMRCSGQLLYAKSLGATNSELAQVFAISHGPMSKIENVIWYGDRLSKRSPLFDSCTMELQARYGDVSQEAFAISGDEENYSPACRLNYVSAVYTRTLRKLGAFDDAKPDFSFLIYGRPLFDPRISNDTNRKSYSNNAALVILDYLLDPDGANKTIDDIDLNSFIVAANICDEKVPCKDNDQPEGLIARYTINGIIDMDNSPEAIIETLESACCGFVYPEAGLWKIKVGAKTAPVATIDRSWLTKKEEMTLFRGRAEDFNLITGTYNDFFLGNIATNYYPIKDAERQKIEGVANKPFDFPLTTSHSTACRLAQIKFNQNTKQSKIKLTLDGYKAMDLAFYDTVILRDICFAGDKYYRIIEFNELPTLEVEVMLQSIDYNNEFYYNFDAEVPQTADSQIDFYNNFPVIHTAKASLTNQGNGKMSVAVRWIRPRFYETWWEPHFQLQYRRIDQPTAAYTDVYADSNNLISNQGNSDQDDDLYGISFNTNDDWDVNILYEVRIKCNMRNTLTNTWSNGSWRYTATSMEEIQKPAAPKNLVAVPEWGQLNFDYSDAATEGLAVHLTNVDDNYSYEYILKLTDRLVYIYTQNGLFSISLEVPYNKVFLAKVAYVNLAGVGAWSDEISFIRNTSGAESGGL